MIKLTKLPIIAISTIAIISSCSIFKPTRKSLYKEPVEQSTTPVITDNFDEVEQEEDITNNIDSLSLEEDHSIDVIAIPDDGDEYESIIFSEEQTKAVRLAEYRDTTINDLAIMLTEMDSTKFHYPAPAVSYVTSPYGWRRGRMHAGIDLKVYVGDDLHAAFDGVVRVAQYSRGYGYYVVIRHYNGLETLYGHCSKLLVNVNQKVKAGDVIALGGNTGRSTGSHLHFEVRIAGHYINPNLVIDTKTKGLKDKNLYITIKKNRLFASNEDSQEIRQAEIIRQLSIKYYTVRSGDMLSKIAARNHTTVATLCRLNHISSRTILRIGQRLIVRDGIRPPVGGKSVAKNSTVAKKSTSQASHTTSSNISTGNYKVRSGDTLSKIASRNGTTISTLCDLNNITERTVLQIGRTLKVPGSGNISSGSSSSSPSRYYTVRSGDTLSKIASRNGTTVASLCSLNNISKNTVLRIGQKLALSGSRNSNRSTSASSGAASYYKVKSGDVLSTIAERNNTTVSSICRLNGISKNSTLQIGQKLRIR